MTNLKNGASKTTSESRVRLTFVLEEDARLLTELSALGMSKLGFYDATARPGGSSDNKHAAPHVQAPLFLRNWVCIPFELISILLMIMRNRRNADLSGSSN